MSINTALRAVSLVLCLLFIGSGSVWSQDFLLDRKPLTLTPPPRLSANTPTLSQTGPIAPAATVAACACHNLNGVSVICEDCDRETRQGYCHTHDRACQDAALKGGIREHTTFFCTTPDG